MTGRLAGRRAIITGAARGIGAEMARTFAAEGAAVAVSGLSASAAAAVGGTAHVVDLRDVAATRVALGDAIGALGGVDVLVNDAGVLRNAPLLEFGADDWDDMFAVTTRPVLVATQASDDAGHLTGQAINVTGGMVM